MAGGWSLGDNRPSPSLKESGESLAYKTCCKDGCDNAAIHSACTEPQTAQFLWEEWRCGWPGWQEQYP